MHAGQLKQIVDLIEATQVKDARGDLTEQWNVYASVHADIQPLIGKKGFEMHHQNYQADYKIVIRFIADIASAMRIRYQGKTYRMVAPPVNTGMRNVQLELYCVEVVHD